MRDPEIVQVLLPGLDGLRIPALDRDVVQADTGLAEAVACLGPCMGVQPDQQTVGDQHVDGAGAIVILGDRSGAEDALVPMPDV